MSGLYFDTPVILLDIDGSSKEEVLRMMAQNLVSNELVKQSFVEAVVQRENEYATGLPTGDIAVAIPHTDVEHVQRKAISVGILRDPVDFIVMGDDKETVPVKIVFMLAMDEAHSQLKLLQQLMQVFQDQNVLKELSSTSDKKQIKKMMEEKLEALSFKGGER
ncbi:PTS sugar transporter subunit IIA [Marinococcus halophilus]|uniref:PTS sugar transporter subunit IIA n=1 Tax=Marinococcus halophilus TaxID=1371 RepID=A0A510Y8D8_MARHA|nr:PTS sugar transporter subunit IIA [Marinococcus halophilus]OZT79332.1 PTS sugar transporter subunit IIA [Marinococcus halophilus]GEK59619.1 PTS sugar transporter subunit IIA [Marinococcus halophilus]